MTGPSWTLKTVLFAAFHGSEFVTIAGKLPQDADILGWDKAAFYQANTEQIPNPFGIFCVILVPLYSLDPFRVGNHNTDVAPEELARFNEAYEAFMEAEQAMGPTI